MLGTMLKEKIPDRERKGEVAMKMGYLCEEVSTLASFSKSSVFESRCAVWLLG
jgi:hypothetical protein